MKTDFTSCSLDDLSTVTGGQAHYDSDLNQIPAKDWKASGTISKRQPFFRVGKPDHPTPLPTPYVDGTFPFVHIN